MTSLTKQQQKTLAYLIGTLLALALAGGMLLDGSRKSAEAAALRQEVERKELEAETIQVPTPEEQAGWAESERRLASVLLSDAEVPQFLADVTRLADQYKLQRFNINTEDKVLDPNQPATAEETRMVIVGIRRYLLVSIRFAGDYADAARFLGAVSQLPRPIEFQTVDMQRNPPWINVNLILKVYKQEAR
jgi:Tfp pilus assembly protein PilO